MDSHDTPIDNVMDTALWVAVYRARESERPDALFKDPFARRLAGEKGERIEGQMTSRKYVMWSLVMRTVAIDDYVRKAVAEGFDTIVNLGAGLDTRPYRLDLPASLRWVEVDFPEMIDYKSKILKEEKPHCQLERISADLSNDVTRRETLAQIAKGAKKALVITEGVIIYLNEANVGALADEIHSHPEFKLWVTEYFAPHMRRFIQSSRQKKQMRNAPMLFWPVDWMGFFKIHRWQQKEIRYLPEVSVRLKRPVPAPWWAQVLMKLIPKKPEHLRYMGYVLWEPKA